MLFFFINIIKNKYENFVKFSLKMESIAHVFSLMHLVIFDFIF